MKKVLVLLMALTLTVGMSFQELSASEKPTFTANYIEVNTCKESELLKHVRLESTMKYSTQSEGVMLKEITFTVNGVSMPVEFEVSYNEDRERTEFDYYLNACEFYEANVTEAQKIEIIQYNEVIDGLILELETLKENHYDETTHKYDTEENAKEGSRLGNQIALNEYGLRDEVINDTLLYALRFENNLDQEFIFSFSTDYRGTSTEGSQIPMNFKDKETTGPETDPEKPEEKEEESPVEETIEKEESIKPIETPNTSVANPTSSLVLVIVISSLAILVMKKKRIN